MMKRLKVTLFASLMVLGVSLSAFANEAQPINVAPAETIQQFTDADMQLVFEQDTQTMQLAALSQTEMKETEGAFVWWAPSVVGAGLQMGAYRYYTPAYQRTGWGYAGAAAFGATLGGRGALYAYGLGRWGSGYAFGTNAAISACRWRC